MRGILLIVIMILDTKEGDEKLMDNDNKRNSWSFYEEDLIERGGPQFTNTLCFWINYLVLLAMLTICLC